MPTDRKDVTFSALFEETLRLVKAYPIPLLGLPILLGIFTSAGNAKPQYKYTPTTFPNPLEYLPFYALIGLLALVAIALLLLASAYVALVTTRAALDAGATGSAPDLGAAMRGIKPQYSSGLGTFVLWVIAVVVGFILLIVPGFIVLSGLFPTVAVVVAEGRFGTEALRRAWNLTNGHKWTIFLFGLVVLLASGVASAILGIIPLIGNVLGGIVSGAANGFLLVAAVVFYQRQTASTPEAVPSVDVPPAAAPPAW